MTGDLEFNANQHYSKLLETHWPYPYRIHCNSRVDTKFRADSLIPILERDIITDEDVLQEIEQGIKQTVGEAVQMRAEDFINKLGEEVVFEDVTEAELVETAVNSIMEREAYKPLLTNCSLCLIAGGRRSRYITCNCRVDCKYILPVRINVVSTALGRGCGQSPRLEESNCGRALWNTTENFLEVSQSDSVTARLLFFNGPLKIEVRNPLHHGTSRDRVRKLLCLSFMSLGIAMLLLLQTRTMKWSFAQTYPHSS